MLIFRVTRVSGLVAEDEAITAVLRLTTKDGVRLPGEGGDVSGSVGQAESL